MNRAICTLALVAAAALAGCDRTDTSAVNVAADEATNAPVVLPPAIAASHAYRCRDNSLIYIDWYADGSAQVKMSRNEAGVRVPAATEADATPATPAAPQLQGSPSATSVTYNGKTCRR